MFYNWMCTGIRFYKWMYSDNVLQLRFSAIIMIIFEPDFQNTCQGIQVLPLSRLSQANSLKKQCLFLLRDRVLFQPCNPLHIRRDRQWFCHDIQSTSSRVHNVLTALYPNVVSISISGENAPGV